MDKVETSITQVMNNLHTTSQSKATTIYEDIKALFKVGIVNSNLITVFTGFWLALYFTDTPFLAKWDIFVLTIFGSACILIGASVLNNWYDVDIDPVMERTKTRPTVTGNIPLQAALHIGIIFSVIGFVVLLFTTKTAAIIAFTGWVTYVFLYTMWSKRRYTLNTEIGCISGAVPPLIGWAAISPEPHIVPVVLFMIMFIWQTPHFLALAMKNKEQYEAANIPMLPAVHGFEITKRQIVVYTACLSPLPFFLGSLGIAFLVITTILNIVWLLVGFSGFFMKDDIKWASMMFFYSLVYLMAVFSTMVLVTMKLPFI